MNINIDEILDSIKNSESTEQFEKEVYSGVKFLIENNLQDESKTLGSLSKFSENRFSRIDTMSNFKDAKIRVVNYLETLSLKLQSSPLCAELIVDTILNNFYLFCRHLYKNKAHKKCSRAIQDGLNGLSVENEYDLQKLIYPIIITLFPCARIEETDDTDHHSIRKDIVLDSEGIAIELKCTRATMSERLISEEIAADIIHYKEHILFFFIYDKENIITVPQNFKNTYEEKDVDGKTVHIIILSDNKI